MLPTLNINVYGLGYVGTITAICLARRGHYVTVIDSNEKRINNFNQGHLVVPEKDLKPLYQDVVNKKLIKAISTNEAPPDAKIWIVCVGTPLGDDGSMDFSQIDLSLKTIAHCFTKIKHEKPILLIRSTVTPGFLRNRAIPLIEKESGLKHGKDFEAFSLPEFLREGSAVKDFLNPALNIIGYVSDSSSINIIEKVFYDDLPLQSAIVENVEIIKCASNTYHAMKIAFANEIGSICKSLGIDSQKTMEIFRSDTKLNSSGAYLRPGYAYGGPCLPKDIKSLLGFAKQYRLKLPLIENIDKSNNEHIHRALSIISSLKTKKLTILGASFKPNTGDFRGSPIIELIDRIRENNNVEITIIDDFAFELKSILKNFKNCKVEESLNLSNEKLDLLILGSKKLSTQEIENIKLYDGPILDLLYNSQITQLINTKTNFISIC